MSMEGEGRAMCAEGLEVVLYMLEGVRRVLLCMLEVVEVSSVCWRF